MFKLYRFELSIVRVMEVLGLEVRAIEFWSISIESSIFSSNSLNGTFVSFVGYEKGPWSKLSLFKIYEKNKK